MITLLSVVFGILILPIFFTLKLKVQENSEKSVKMIITLLGFILYSGTVELRFKNGILPEIYEVRKKSERLVYRPGMKRGKSGIFFRAAGRVFIVKKFDLMLRVGTQDAACSALICGLLCILADIGAGITGKRLKSAKVDIRPDFEKTGVDFKLNCIILFRVADIIKKVFTILKGGKKNAPNRKHTEGNYVRA